MTHLRTKDLELLIEQAPLPAETSNTIFTPNELFARIDAARLDGYAQSELLTASDVVSLHARWTPETEGMMNADAFAMMKPGAHFINTSRGILVDEVALADALRSGHIGFAALDTHQPEPRNSTSPLHDAPRTIFTSHIAGGSRSVLLSEVETMAEKAAEVLE